MNWYKKAQAENVLSLHFPDNIHQNYGVTLISEDQKLLMKFVYYCKAKLDKRLMAFWQSGLPPSTSHEYPSYQFFEFWTTDLDLIIRECEKLSEYMGLKVEGL